MANRCLPTTFDSHCAALAVVQHLLSGAIEGLRRRRRIPAVLPAPPESQTPRTDPERSTADRAPLLLRSSPATSDSSPSLCPAHVSIDKARLASRPAASATPA